MSRKLDTVETVINTVAGVGIGYFINLVVLPWFGIHMDTAKATSVTVIYMMVSYIRAYGLRRLFRVMGARYAD